MEIIDKGFKMALYEDGVQISPDVSRIVYNREGWYSCFDRVKVPLYMKQTIEVVVSFSINSLTHEIKGPVYNNYFKSTDYIAGLDDYEYYKERLKNRIRNAEFKEERKKATNSKQVHWRFRK